MKWIWRGLSHGWFGYWVIIVDCGSLRDGLVRIRVWCGIDGRDWNVDEET